MGKRRGEASNRIKTPNKQDTFHFIILSTFKIIPHLNSRSLMLIYNTMNQKKNSSPPPRTALITEHVFVAKYIRAIENVYDY